MNICSNKGLTIIDTPCLGGKEKDEVEILKTIMNYVKLMRQFKGILILFDSFEFRVSNNIISMIKNFCNVFGSEIIYNIAFVFTKHLGDLKKERKEKMKQKNIAFAEEIKKLIDNSFGGKKNYHFPIFFIDSDLENEDEDSINERDKIINWARSLANIDTNKLK